MKLDHECIRDVMLTIEENLPMNVHLRIEQIHMLPKLDNYSRDELLYCLSKLYEAGFIDGRTITSDIGLMDFALFEMTFEGHQFLDNIRDPKVWKMVKEKASVLKSVSITVMSDIGLRAVKKLLDFD